MWQKIKTTYICCYTYYKQANQNNFSNLNFNYCTRQNLNCRGLKVCWHFLFLQSKHTESFLKIKTHWNKFFSTLDYNRWTTFWISQLQEWSYILIISTETSPTSLFSATRKKWVFHQPQIKTHEYYLSYRIKVAAAVLHAFITPHLKQQKTTKIAATALISWRGCWLFSVGHVNC